MGGKRSFILTDLTVPGHRVEEQIITERRNRFHDIGCRISGAVSDFAANPFAQVGLILICLAWLYLGMRVDVLTAGLSIVAITLTQMVLNRQLERERDASRRDIALHAKLDELLHASKRARDELAGVEELEVEQIQELRETGLTREDDASG